MIFNFAKELRWDRRRIMLKWTEKKALVIQKDYRTILDLNLKTLSSNINTGSASLFYLLLHKHLLCE